MKMVSGVSLRFALNPSAYADGTDLADLDRPVG